MNKIAKTVRGGVAAAATVALIGLGGAAAVAADGPTWADVVRGCPDQADNTEMKAELEYYHMGILTSLPADIAACAAAGEQPGAGELPEGDTYDVDEDAYQDYAEFIYNQMEDAQNDAQRERDYLDAAEKEYNRLLAEQGGSVDGGTQTDPTTPPAVDEGTQTDPEKVDAGTQTDPEKVDVATQTDPEKVDAATQTEPALAETGATAGVLGGIAALVAVAGGSLVAVRRRFN